MTAPMVVPTVLPEKKRRNSRHYKAELAAMEQRYARQVEITHEVIDREGSTHLKVECIKHAAELDFAILRNRVRVWRLVALGLALFAALTLAALAVAVGR